MNPNELILGIDPGRVKVGLALVETQTIGEEKILWRGIVPAAELRTHLEKLLDEHPIARIALGDSTASAPTAALLAELLAARNSDLQLEIVDERDSTLQARAVYFEHNPPRGWRKLVPQSLQEPPEPIDDFAAVILTRRLLR